jgi:hypothetical protein
VDGLGGGVGAGSRLKLVNNTLVAFAAEGGPGLDEPGDPIAQTLVELFADVKRRLLETVTVQAPRERLGRDPADHDDPRPGDRAGPDSSGPSR